jgi:hypothetical protein
MTSVSRRLLAPPMYLLQKQPLQQINQTIQTDITILCKIESFIYYCFEVIKFLKTNNSFPAVQRRNTE